MWPTPTAHPDNSNKNGKFKNPTLGDAVRDRETWPTPVASDAWTGDLKSTQQTEGSRHSLNLSTAVQKWPTPTASDWKGRGPNSKQQGLSEVVKYPTMSASGMGNTGSQQMLQKHVDSGSLTEEEKRGMTAGNGGRLNPTWVEWLMGFPTGWTDLEDSETL
jgi:DNA (cytosine-5)-methyltransferase 1